MGARTPSRLALRAVTPLLALASTSLGVPVPVRPTAANSHSQSTAQVLALDLSRTRPLGPGAAYRPRPRGALVGRAAAWGTLRCRRPTGRRYGAHLELFAAGHMILIPAGIGLAPPLHQEAAVVSGERCAYPLHTREPTGVIEIDAAHAPPGSATLGQLFRLWAQPLSRVRLAAFSSPAGGVVAYLDGRSWPGDPGTIPLSRHAQIVVEVGPHVDPHPSYRFPPGL